MRDDPVVDYYLDTLMLEDQMNLQIEALKLLRQPKTIIASAEGMDEAVIFQKDSIRLGKINTMVLGEWIVRGYVTKIQNSVRVQKYKLSPAGVKICKEHNDGLHVDETTAAPVTKARRIRGETPLYVLSRRKGRDGQPYITRAEYEAGARLYEDFYNSRLPDGIPSTINWDHFGMSVDITVVDGNIIPINWYSTSGGNRFDEAIRHAGIGLADILLLCVCYEHGLEECEKKLGWSARSGKVVLKIALGRMVEFYGKSGRGEMIGS